MENPEAFPRPVSDVETYEYGRVTYGSQDGMTLMDYFAAKAMQSIVIDASIPNEKIAAISYSIAEAMLKEREGRVE